MLLLILFINSNNTHVNWLRFNFTTGNPKVLLGEEKCKSTTHFRNCGCRVSVHAGIWRENSTESMCPDQVHTTNEMDSTCAEKNYFIPFLHILISNYTSLQNEAVPFTSADDFLLEFHCYFHYRYRPTQWCHRGSVSGLRFKKINQKNIWVS